MIVNPQEYYIGYNLKQEGTKMTKPERFIDKANQATLEYLQKRALENRNNTIERIKKFAQMKPDHPFTHANQHVLQLSEQTSWDGAGLLSMVGLGWWTLNLSVDILPVSVVSFNASGGPDWTVSVFSATVAGYFLVDPSTLDGEDCDFQMEAVGGGDTEASINLYQPSGSQIGSFMGLGIGGSVSKVSGSGTLHYHTT